MGEVTEYPSLPLQNGVAIAYGALSQLLVIDASGIGRDRMPQTSVEAEAERWFCLCGAPQQPHQPLCKPREYVPNVCSQTEILKVALQIPFHVWFWDWVCIIV